MPTHMKKLATIPILLCLILSSCTSNNTYYRITGYAQGGTYNVTYSDINITPDSLKVIIDSVLTSIDNSLSGYNKNSILTKINNNTSHQADTIFKEIFEISYDIYKETEGMFDPSAAPLFDIWGFGFKEKEKITPEKIDSVKQFIGMDKISVRGDSIIKNDSRTKLNFNAIAQGFSCDLVARELDRRGVENYLVEVGMEIYCKGANPSGEMWNIGVDTPEDGNMEAGKKINEIISVSDAGIVTSGNYRKFYIEDGKKFSHTIDPISGYPVTHSLLSATIIASDATLADAYATYCMTLGLERAVEFLNSRPELQGYLIYDQDGEMKVFYTENLKQQLVKQ